MNREVDEGDDAPALEVGHVVVVRALPRKTHYRTPSYIQGKTGAIVRCCGTHGDPEEIAYGVKPARLRRLYRVRFAQKAIWPEYSGSPNDTIDVEIYEHWLTPDGALLGDS